MFVLDKVKHKNRKKSHANWNNLLNCFSLINYVQVHIFYTFSRWANSIPLPWNRLQKQWNDGDSSSLSTNWAIKQCFTIELRCPELQCHTKQAFVQKICFKFIKKAKEIPISGPSYFYFPTTNSIAPDTRIKLLVCKGSKTNYLQWLKILVSLNVASAYALT